MSDQNEPFIWLALGVAALVSYRLDHPGLALICLITLVLSMYLAFTQR